MKSNRIIVLSGAIVVLVIVVIALVYQQRRIHWKKNYLAQIYPLAKPEELTDALFDTLQVLFVKLLPSHVIEQMKKNAYTAILPGPSCGQLPCPCLDKTAPCTGDPGKKFNLPTVQFSPDPILDKRWPPCNLPGEKGKMCCRNTDTYMTCMSDGTFDKLNVGWLNGDTWEGNSENANQPPPSKGQLFKPALWPDYTLAVSAFDPKNWNSSSPAAGSSDGYIEGLHSAFSSNFELPGVWFYNAKGSGIFVSLDTSRAGGKSKSLVALNKIHALEILFRETYPDKDPYTELANFIMRPNDGDIINDNSNCAGWLSEGALDTQTKDLTVSTTGMDGQVQYWLNGQNRKLIADTISPLNAAKLAAYLKAVTNGKDYNTNRFANTGSIDNLIVYLARNLDYTSIQFTVQPNVYTGWTTEVILMGPPKTESKKMFTQLDDVKHLISIRGKDCTRSQQRPWRLSKCLHCDELPYTGDTCGGNVSGIFKSCANYC
jgi:hypothetical protein